jgi:putative addiction module killer protein
MKFEILTTDEFDAWLTEQQPKTRVIVKARLDHVALGHFGDHKRFDGLIELRWKNGTRVYSFHWGQAIVVALYGGNKHGQDRDIKKAKRIRDEVLEGLRTVRK